jgi:cytochrome d ubiquinol oxidase subunit II
VSDPAVLALLQSALPDATTALTWTLPNAVAGTMVLSLNAYVLLAGADFGGGVWDLFARGRDQDEQRALIEEAIGPIWEANHVWLILVVVLLFTCFPRAYAHLATELHVPITLMLVGIVLRGSAFTFRTYDSTRDAVQRRWGRIFSVASFATPVLLGLCLGAVASGRVPLRTATVTGPALGSAVGAGIGATSDAARAALASTTFTERFIMPWLASPFAWAVGLLALGLFAFLAATYLTVEAREPELQEVFRRRALQTQAALLLMAAATILLAARDAPLVFEGLTQGSVALGMHVVTGVAAITSIMALRRRRYQLARLAAAAQASFILWGWAWSQYPRLLPPDLTITEMAAPRVTLVLVLTVLAVGTAILLPSFVYLFRVFKTGGTAFERE